MAWLAKHPDFKDGTAFSVSTHVSRASSKPRHRSTDTPAGTCIDHTYLSCFDSAYDQHYDCNVDVVAHLATPIYHASGAHQENPYGEPAMGTMHAGATTVPQQHAYECRCHMTRSLLQAGTALASKPRFNLKPGQQASAAVPRTAGLD